MLDWLIVIVWIKIKIEVRGFRVFFVFVLKKFFIYIKKEMSFCWGLGRKESYGF